VSAGVIYGFRPGFEHYPDAWFVVIPLEKIERRFLDQESEWRSFLIERGIDTIQLHHSWTIFDEFKSNKILPWFNPKKGIYPDKSGDKR
jgi:hypothetical protein